MLLRTFRGTSCHENLLPVAQELKHGITVQILHLAVHLTIPLVCQECILLIIYDGQSHQNAIIEPMEHKNLTIIQYKSKTQ